MAKANDYHLSQRVGETHTSSTCAESVRWAQRATKVAITWNRSLQRTGELKRSNVDPWPGGVGGGSHVALPPSATPRQRNSVDSGPPAGLAVAKTAQSAKRAAREERSRLATRRVVMTFGLSCMLELPNNQAYSAGFPHKVRNARRSKAGITRNTCRAKQPTCASSRMPV